ncbi:MAG: DUF5682 family protein, partial [Actinomycetia bacterium]|nr:DUF5682 family protein [Actinomycetes bacterium]
EGPPEADVLAALAADPAMRPPVALLAHVVDDPARAGFWPFAEFSPEWVALQWAAKAGAEVRFIDLPAAHSLALREAEAAEEDAEQALGQGVPTDPPQPTAPAQPGGPAQPGTAGGPFGTGTPADGTDPAAQPPAAAGRPDGSAPGNAGPGAPRIPAPQGRCPGEPDAGDPALGDPALGDPDAGDLDAGDPDVGDPVEAVRIDPLAVLARTAGYDDPERWWEDAVEHRGSRTESAPGGVTDEEQGAGALAAFAALAEAMGALRQTYGDGGHTQDPLREAHMRLRVREARRAHARTAVVCGAWHVPALAAKATATADRALLKGLPKVKVETTWVPWTHRRLARASGYGAGIDSPGWYRHLFTAPDRPVTRWMTKVAGLLREEDYPVSSAHVIEAVRLADTLAAMRGRPLAGLGETTDAVRSVMCDGSDVPLALIQDRLVVGDVLGEVPPDAPAVPLARDLAREQRAWRLKPEALERELELDLRKDLDAGRSRLLHRLRLLRIGWGEPVASRGGKGTFRETWRLRWEPEAAIRVAEAGIWGTTVESAATARAEDLAVHATTLAEVTAVAEQCLPAGLSGALPTVMQVLADRAALDADVAHLAAALPALVRAVRYGDVRGTDSTALGAVAHGLAQRICVGFPAACTGVDADAARALRTHMDEVHRAVGLLPGPAQTSGAEGRTDGRAPAPGAASAPLPGPGDPAQELRDRWAAVLRSLAERDGAIPGLLRGAAARLLMDDGRLDAGEAARLMGLALSPGTGPAEAAAWIEGFLAGGGILLVHDERLLALIDGWLAGVSAEAFTDVLPLLRRTFADFEPGVRRSVGELVRRGPATTRRATGPADAGLPGFGTALDPHRADTAAHTVRLLLGTLTTTDLGEQGDD